MELNASTVTRESCLGACGATGFTYAGLEYGDECYCDFTLQNNGVIEISEDSCSMACAGNSSETCGGLNALNLFISNEGN